MVKELSPDLLSKKVILLLLVLIPMLIFGLNLIVSAFILKDQTLWNETEFTIADSGKGSIAISLPGNHSYEFEFSIWTTDTGGAAYMRGDVQFLIHYNRTLENLTLYSFDIDETGRNDEGGLLLMKLTANKPASFSEKGSISNLEMTAMLFIIVEFPELSENIQPVALDIYQDPPEDFNMLLVSGLILMVIPVMILAGIVFIFSE